MTRKVHFILQGKGGVGKSFVAALLAQHYQANGRGAVVCVDTDPVNATFSGYEAFKTRRVELLDNGTVDSGRFDALMMSIVTEDADFIVDNGASCFIPLTKYLFESNALEVIAGQGREVVFHSVLTGGYGLRDTVAGFDWLAENMPVETRIVVWLNEFFGAIEAEGKTFEQMKVYQRHQERIAALLRLPKQNEQTFGRDLKAMLDQRLTFAEARGNAQFNLFSKQRIAMMERQLIDQLDLVA
ncbi:MAG: conjugal transfer protein TraL [Anaeromyxobacter sp.]